MALFTSGMAAHTGLDLATGAQRSDVVIPVAAFAAVAIAVVAVAHFEFFVLSVLVMRASLDAVKVGSQSGVGVDPAAGLAVLFMITATLWLAARYHERLSLRRTELRWPFVIFLVTGLVSVINSGRPVTSLLEAARIGAAVVMLVVLEAMLADGLAERSRRVLLAVFMSAVLPLIVTAYQLTQGSGVFQAGGFDRIRGTFLHPNPFAIYLALLIVMGVAVFPHVQAATRVPFFVLLCGAVTALLFTYTRGAWIAAVIGVLVVGARQHKGVIAVVIVGALVVILFVPSVSARFSDLETEENRSGTPGNSLVWRFSYWRETLGLAEDNPLTGIGLKMTNFVTDEAKAPHNDFVRTYVETGLLGLAAYLNLLAALVRSARRSLRRARPGLERGIAAGFAGCLAAFLLVSVTSNVISQVVILWYFAAFAALGASVAAEHRSEPAAT